MSGRRRSNRLRRLSVASQSAAASAAAAAAALAPVIDIVQTTLLAKPGLPVPNDIHDLIFEYLDLEAATRFSLASKACRDAVRSVSVFRRRHLARTGTNFRTTPAHPNELEQDRRRKPRDRWAVAVATSLCQIEAWPLVPFLVSLDRLLSRPYGPKGSFPKGSVGFDLRGIDFTSIPSTVTRRSPRGKLSHAGGMPGEHHSGVAGHPSIRGLSIRGLSHDPDVGAMLPPGSTWDDDSGGWLLQLGQWPQRNVVGVRFSDRNAWRLPFAFKDPTAHRIVDVSFCESLGSIDQLKGIGRVDLTDCAQLADVTALAEAEAVVLRNCPSVLDVRPLASVATIDLSGCSLTADSYVGELARADRIDLDMCIHVPVAELRKLVAVKELDVMSLTRLADDFASLSDIAMEERLYRRVLAINPAHIDTLHNLGILLTYDRPDIGAAIAIYKVALATDPDNTRILGNYGTLLYHEKGDRELAEKVFRRVLELDPENVAAMQNLSSLLCDHGAEGETALGTDYADTRLREAEAILRTALACDPDGIDTLFNLAVLLQCEKGDDDGAVEYFKRALEVDPTHVASLANLANLFRERKQADDAEGCYRRALVVTPLDADILSDLGLLLQEVRKDPAAAEAVYLEALTIDPNHLISLFNLGNLKQFDLHDADRAEELYRKVIRLAPEDIGALCNLGLLLLFERNDPDEAEQMYRRVLEIEPDDADSMCNLGLVLDLKRQDASGAARLYEQALALNGDHRATLCLYGWLLWDQLHDFPKATEMLDREVARRQAEPVPDDNVHEIVETCFVKLEAAVLGGRSG